MGPFLNFLLYIGVAVSALQGGNLLGMGQCIGTKMAIGAGKASVGGCGKQVGGGKKAGYLIGGAKEGLLPLGNAHHARQGFGAHGGDGGIAMAAQTAAVVLIRLSRAIGG